MQFATLSAAFVCLPCLLFALSAAETDAPDAPQVKVLPVTPEIEAASLKAMQGCPPEGRAVRGAINKNGVFTLTGDLFDNGNNYAVIDNSGTAIICEWQKSQWKPISLLDADIEWNRPGWKTDDNSPRWRPEATKPFWTLTLKHHTLLVVASTMDKYHQNYFVILLNSKCESILDTASSYRLLPIVKFDYLITENDSRRKAVCEGTYFSQIQNNKFVVAKTWEEYAPNDAYEGEAFCNIASSNGKFFTIMPDYSKSDHSADWVIFADKLIPDGGRSIMDTWKNNKAYAKLYFSLRKPKDIYANADAPEKELAYVFEKLTGLSRELYRVGDDIGLKGKIESTATIKVTGSDEAVKLLSPDPR